MENMQEIVENAFKKIIFYSNESNSKEFLEKLLISISSIEQINLSKIIDVAIEKNPKFYQDFQLKSKLILCIQQKNFFEYLINNEYSDWMINFSEQELNINFCELLVQMISEYDNGPFLIRYLNQSLFNKIFHKDFQNNERLAKFIHLINNFCLERISSLELLNRVYLFYDQKKFEQILKIFLEESPSLENILNLSRLFLNNTHTYELWKLCLQFKVTFLDYEIMLLIFIKKKSIGLIMCSMVISLKRRILWNFPILKNFLIFFHFIFAHFIPKKSLHLFPSASENAFCKMI